MKLSSSASRNCCIWPSQVFQGAVFFFFFLLEARQSLLISFPLCPPNIPFAMLPLPFLSVAFCILPLSIKRSAPCVGYWEAYNLVVLPQSSQHPYTICRWLPLQPCEMLTVPICRHTTCEGTDQPGRGGLPAPVMSALKVRCLPSVEDKVTTPFCETLPWVPFLWCSQTLNLTRKFPGSFYAHRYIHSVFISALLPKRAPGI